MSVSLGSEDSPAFTTGSAVATSSERKASRSGGEQRKRKKPKTASGRSHPTSQPQPSQSSPPTSLPSPKVVPNCSGKASTQKVCISLVACIRQSSMRCMGTQGLSQHQVKMGGGVLSPH